jgi:ribosomal protein S27E
MAMAIEIKCGGCGEWIPIPRLEVTEGGIVALCRKYMCPVCRTVLYEESPSFRDWLAEELAAGKDNVRVNDDPFSRFPPWGTAEIGLEDLQRVEVICYRCKRWIPYPRLKTEYTTSISVGWRLTYHCPNCGTQLGSSHGGDPSYNIAPADFEDLVLEAVREGRGWARLMSEAR